MSDETQLNLKKQLTDQSLHAIGAALMVFPLALYPAWFTAAWAGFVLGTVREITQRGTPVHLENFTKTFTSKWSCLDIAFWTLGALVTWLVLA